MTQGLKPFHQPKSPARDFYGFSQRELYKFIEAYTLSEMWKKLTALITDVTSINENGLFFHTYTKLILFKKVDLAAMWDQLRAIGILPAWIMLIKKATLPVVAVELGPLIYHYQQGALSGREMNLAKFKVLLNAKLREYKKHALLDTKKAFDSVDRQRLKVKIMDSSIKEEVKDLMIQMHHIDRALMYTIAEQAFQPTVGNLQGDPWSGILYVFYVNDAVMQTSSDNPSTFIQGFFDDIIISATRSHY